MASDSLVVRIGRHWVSARIPQCSRNTSYGLRACAYKFGIALVVERSGRPRDWILMHPCIFAGTWYFIHLPQECRHDTVKGLQKHRTGAYLLLAHFADCLAMASSWSRHQRILSFSTFHDEP